MTTTDWEDRRMSGTGDLARFLGGSEDSFTGLLLVLITKAQSTPENYSRLKLAFPREVRAWEAWNSMSPVPTFRELREALQEQDAELQAENVLAAEGSAVTETAGAAWSEDQGFACCGGYYEHRYRCPHRAWPATATPEIRRQAVRSDCIGPAHAEIEDLILCRLDYQQRKRLTGILARIWDDGCGYDLVIATQERENLAAADLDERKGGEREPR